MGACGRPSRTFVVRYSSGLALEVDACCNDEAIARALTITPESAWAGAIRRVGEKPEAAPVLTRAGANHARGPRGG